MGKWAEQYKHQPPATATLSSTAVAPAAEDFILPVMTLRDKCKAPTESVPLQIFEPRYRLLMKLVNSSASRLFGVLLRKGDTEGGEMESGEPPAAAAVWRCIPCLCPPGGAALCLCPTVLPAVFQPELVASCLFTNHPPLP